MNKHTFQYTHTHTHTHTHTILTRGEGGKHALSVYYIAVSLDYISLCRALVPCPLHMLVSELLCAHVQVTTQLVDN